LGEDSREVMGDWDEDEGPCTEAAGPGEADGSEAEGESVTDAPDPDAEDLLGPGGADFGDDDEDGVDVGFPTGPGLAGTSALAVEDLKGALESLILVSDKPVPAVRLARLTRQDLGVVRRALAEITADYRGRGMVLDEIAGGFQFRTSPRFAPFVRMLVQQKPTRLSRAQLEVLSNIAYRLPVTRPEIDDVRGVDSGSAIKLLLERNVIKIIGKKEEAGRPILYGTTPEFLSLFGLNTLRDLPTLREFAELTAESRDMFERRIGEPLPGQGQGMDLSTHYEAPPDIADPGEDSAEHHDDGPQGPEVDADYEAPSGEDP